MSSPENQPGKGSPSSFACFASNLRFPIKIIDPVMETELNILLTDVPNTLKKARTIINETDRKPPRFRIRTMKVCLMDYLSTLGKFKPAKGEHDIYNFSEKVIVLPELCCLSAELQEIYNELPNKYAPAVTPPNDGATSISSNVSESLSMIF